MELQAAQAAYDRLHEDRPYHNGTFTDWAEKADELHPYRYTDGVTIDVADFDLDPDDHFMDDEFAQPRQLVAEQSPGDQDQPSDQSA